MLSYTEYRTLRLWTGARKSENTHKQTDKRDAIITISCFPSRTEWERKVHPRQNPGYAYGAGCQLLSPIDSDMSNLSK